MGPSLEEEEEEEQAKPAQEEQPLPASAAWGWRNDGETLLSFPPDEKGCQALRCHAATLGDRPRKYT